MKYKAEFYSLTSVQVVNKAQTRSIELSMKCFDNDIAQFDFMVPTMINQLCN